MIDDDLKEIKEDVRRAPGDMGLEDWLAHINYLLNKAEELRMASGRLEARHTVFMQAMAWVARMGYKDMSDKWRKRSDEAAKDVRPEDFVRVQQNQEGSKDGN